MWVWPVPGQIAEACQLFAPRTAPESEDSTRRRQAEEMAEGYTHRYMKTSKLARLARQEGWAEQLRYYVRAASWVQAQLIHHVENIGWEAGYLTKPEQFRSSEEAFASYRKRIEGPVSRGEIRVHVPTDRIGEWKAAAETHQETATPSHRAIDEPRPPRSGQGRY